MSLQGNLGAQQGSLPGVSQLSGLGRQGWQQLVASATGPGVNAAQAAVNLDPFYLSQREKRGQDFGAANGYNGQKYSASGRRRSLSRSGSQGGFGQQYGQANGLNGLNGGLNGLNGQANGLNGQANGLNGLNGQANGLNGGQGGLESGFGMYEGQRSPSQSFRGGTPAESTDVVMDSAESAGMSMLQAAMSPARITNRSGQTFNEVDIARIAQALGIQTQGLNRAAMIAAIKTQVGGLSPRSQTQFLGSQSPRSQQFLGSLATQRAF
uniref:Uncharacterized protein n=1 Tax=viral metagenome TaxID=1070528 RepID=A0A6C0IX91_9ZZZZ